MRRLFSVWWTKRTLSPWKATQKISTISSWIRLFIMCKTNSTYIRLISWPLNWGAVWNQI
jgi:hypothetical protein